MRFAVGQAFVVDGRQAVIAELRDDGRAGPSTTTNSNGLCARSFIIRSNGFRLA